jgi:hypothetical protein
VDARSSDPLTTKVLNPQVLGSPPALCDAVSCILAATLLGGRGAVEGGFPQMLRGEPTVAVGAMIDRVVAGSDRHILFQFGLRSEVILGVANTPSPTNASSPETRPESESFHVPGLLLTCTSYPIVLLCPPPQRMIRICQLWLQAIVVWN